MTVEEELESKKQEEEKAKAEEVAKAEAAKKAEAEEQKKKEEAAKAEEEKRRVASSTANNQLSEEQWVALEKAYGMPRDQLLKINSIAQAVMAGSPANRLLEKDAWAEAVKGVSDISFFEEDARKEVEALSPQERQDPKKVRKAIMAVRGEKVSGASSTSARRVASGLDIGGRGDRGEVKDEDLPSFQGSAEEKHDEEEVFRKFGFESKKEWDSMKGKEIPVQEGNFVPKFR